MKVKKSTKKIYKALLAAVMILSLSVSVFAYDAYISAGDVKVKTVSFTDAENNPLTSLAAGEMKVSTSVRADVSGKSATLIACAYQGQEMIAMEKFTTTLEEKKSTSMSLMLTVPEGADQVKAFVWDDLNGIYPYSQSAVFASGNVNVREILIDGVPLEGFSNDTASYNVNVNAGYLDYPEMTVRTEDASAKAEITTTDFAVENPVATIKVTNGANSKTFTVTYTKKAPAVTNAKLNADDFKRVTGTDLDSAEQVKLAVLNKPVMNGTTPTSSTAFWYDRSNNVYFSAFPEELEGATVVQTSSSLKGRFPTATEYQAAYPNEGGLLDFEINRSADVYVYVQNATACNWLSNAGFVAGGEATTATVMWGTTPNTCEYWKKTVIVQPGKTEKISLGYFKNGNMGPSAIVKFLDRAPETEMIQNAKFYNSTTDAVIDKTVKITKNVDPSDTTVNAYWPTWRTQTLIIPSQVAGADYLPMGAKWGDITDVDDQSYYCTFELTKSATVYVGMWINGSEEEQRNANPWLEGFEFIPSGFTVGRIESGTPGSKDYGFKKTFEVNPGETVTVTVGPFGTPKRPSDPYTAPYVFVKPE